MSYVDVQWQDDAACQGMDTNIFFPGRGVGPHLAKKVCRACTVSDPCLSYALRNEIPLNRVGVWGGMSADERERKFDGRGAKTGRGL